MHPVASTSYRASISASVSCCGDAWRVCLLTGESVDDGCDGVEVCCVEDDVGDPVSLSALSLWSRSVSTIADVGPMRTWGEWAISLVVVRARSASSCFA